MTTTPRRQVTPTLPLSRRRLALLPLMLGGLTLAGAASRAHAAPVVLPTPGSLALELAAALQARRPLVVMASLPGCPYCRAVRDSHLGRLRTDSQPVVQLDLGSEQAVLGFDGLATTHERQLRAWAIDLAPTLLFFGRGSREVAPRLVGASIPDFYGAYLEERLNTARAALG